MVPRPLQENRGHLPGQGHPHFLVHGGSRRRFPGHRRDGHGAGRTVRRENPRRGRGKDQNGGRSHPLHPDPQIIGADMDQESEGTSLVIFVVGGAVLLLLLLGGGAFFFLMSSSQEDSIRKEVEATSPLKEIHKGLKEFKPEPIFPVDGEKAKNPTAPDGE